MPERDFRLFAAVAEGSDPLAMQRLFSEGTSPEADNPDGETPLTLAARVNNLPAVHALVTAGANVNRRNAKGISPLTFACLCGHEQVVLALLGHGAAINEANTPITPLAGAASAGRLRIIHELLARGADVALRTSSGTTASAANAVASFRPGPGSTSVDSIVSAVPMAVRLSIDSTLRNAPATANLLKATRANDLPGVRAALQARGDPTSGGITALSPLGVAVEQDNIPIVRAMLDAARPAIAAATDELAQVRPRARSAELLGLLLGAGPPPEGEQRDKLVRSILQKRNAELARGLLAPRSGITPGMVLKEAIPAGNEEVVLSIVAGPDTSWFESAGEFAISASSPGREAMLRAITRRAGRRADSRTQSGPPVLHHALLERKLGLLRAVLEAGGNPDVRHDGMSALVRAYAVNLPDAVALLRAHGASSPVDDAALIAAAIDANDREEIAILMSGGLDVLRRGALGRSPLQLAIETGKGAAILAMLGDARVAASVKNTADNGYGLLEAAVSSPSPDYARRSALRALLEAGIPSVPPGSTDLSPLVVAAARDESTDTLLLLSEAGIPLRGVSRAGSSVICFAIEAWATRRDRGWRWPKVESPRNMVDMALAGGADLNVATCELPGGVRGTVLHMLALRRTTNITDQYQDQREDEDAFVRSLLARGADPRIKSSTGKSAADLAKERKDTRLVAILRGAAR
jgi:ankyrin repeat protein